MTTKYTPAPWQAYNAIGGRILNRWHIKGNNHKSLASVHAQDSSEEEAGNAALLAAAPELAEALNECLKALDVAFEFEGDVFGKHHNDAVDALQNARHALQKAGLVS